MEKPLRWGILGSANIARKNWQAICNSGNGIVVAVSSRREESAQRFIEECQSQVPFDEVPRAIGGYENMIAAEDIDAVYIPLPTGMRKEWVIRAAEAGKHVMCEKPCAVSAQDLEEMTAACAANGVQFMDGVMYMHSDRMPLLRGILDDSGNLGDIKRISSAFSFCAPPDFFEGNIRSSGDLEPAGALGDLGWYTIRASLFVLNYEMPIALQARRLSEIGGENSTDPVPTELSGELFFSNGVTASFYNSFLTDNQQWLHVSGTAGQLRVDDFVLPFPGGRSNVTVSKVDAKQDGCLFVMQNEDRILGVEEAHGNDGNSQETKLFRTFARLALGCQPDEFWPEIALKTQRVMDACMASMRADGKRIELTNHKSGFGA